jgi:hypothetical protein
MRATSWLLAMWCIVGCSSKKSPNDAGVDLGAIVDAAAPADFELPTACNPVDSHADGQVCSTTEACPAGTIAVTLGGLCRCWQRCTIDFECACDRVCDALTTSDGGAAGGACLPGNFSGWRCGQDSSTGALFGFGVCAQGLTCIDADSTHRYCAYVCTSAADCPAQTMCDPLSDGTSACAYAAGTAAAGATCTANSNDCVDGQLCDGTCKTQCDGPGATCASGTCTALTDGNKFIGFVCK